MLRNSLISVIFMVWLMTLTVQHSLVAADTIKTTDLTNTLDDLALIKALQSGGYILYFRHGMTDHSTYDRDRHNLANCSTQRLLSEQGREQMRAIGRSITNLNIKVSKIISSPYCRSIDTAVLAFGSMQTNDDLRHTVNADETTAKFRAAALQKLLASEPKPGTNTVISSHTANLQEATGIWPKPEGVAIIFKPDGNEKFKFIARVVPDDWQKLERTLQ